MSSAPEKPPTLADARRVKWGENLSDQLGPLTVKQFHRLLLDAGVDVTTQAIYSWKKGQTAPKPETQAVIARVLGTRPHLLFPVAV